MLVDDNRKRVDLQARQELKDDWANKVQCPVCAAPTLKVIHTQAVPDYFLCSQCELSFEVEKNSGLIRIKVTSEQLMFVEEDLRYNWIDPSILPKLIEKRSQIMQQKIRSVSAQPLTDQEVWHRMLGLHRLGNQPKVIELTLIQAGATPQQTQNAALKLKNLSSLEVKQQNLRLWIIASVTIVLLLTMFAASWVFVNSQINATLSQNYRQPVASNPAQTPLQLINSLPESLKPEFLKGPTPYVEKVGPQPADCPAQAQDAAALFGGIANTWKRGSQPRSWQMINAVGKPVTISIPAGMYAGFINNRTFLFTAADGPATIYNVNFLVISCD